MSADIDAMLAEMRTTLTEHLESCVKAARLRLFGPPPRKHHFVARGVCGWCAQPFMRPMEYVKEWGHAPVLYCSHKHKMRAKEKRTRLANSAHLCPTPHKRTFLSEAVARAETASYGRGLRVYQCDCTGWHVTKRESWLPTPPRRVVAAHA